MPYYETVFESGDVSVAEYADDAEAMSALSAQHERAKTGGKNGPQGGPATRIAAVYKYDSHPGSLNEEGGLSADVLTSELGALVKAFTDKNGVVNAMAFAEGVKGLVHPMAEPSGFSSRFKMKEVATLDLSELG